jgi:hypothetical protein
MIDQEPCSRGIFDPTVNKGVRLFGKGKKAPPRSVTCFVGCYPVEGRFHGPALRRFPLLIGKFCRLLEYLHEHLAGELAGRRVLI